MKLLFPSLLLVLTFVMPASAQWKRDVDPEDVQRIGRADLQGYAVGGETRTLERSDLDLTFVQHDSEDLGDGRWREFGRVSWTRKACGDECYEGEGAEVPVSFAVVDSVAGRLVVVKTVWTNSHGVFEATLPDATELRRPDGSQASALDEYIVMVRTQRAKGLPAEAKRLIESVSNGGN